MRRCSRERDNPAICGLLLGAILLVVGGASASAAPKQDSLQPPRSGEVPPGVTKEGRWANVYAKAYQGGRSTDAWIPIGLTWHEGRLKIQTDGVREPFSVGEDGRFETFFVKGRVFIKDGETFVRIERRKITGYQRSEWAAVGVDVSVSRFGSRRHPATLTDGKAKSPKPVRPQEPTWRVDKKTGAFHPTNDAARKVVAKVHAEHRAKTRLPELQLPEMMLDEHARPVVLKGDRNFVRSARLAPARVRRKARVHRGRSQDIWMQRK
jgi:hypothetical protein